MTTTEMVPASDDAPEARGRRHVGRWVLIAVGLVAVALVAGVVGDDIGGRGSDAPVPLADVVTCSVWTRPTDQQQPVSAGVLTIDWRTASTGEGMTSEEHASGDGLTLTATYSFPYPPEGHVLSVAVADRNGHILHSSLFQMWQGPTNVFGQTDQGFTGLNYAYDPSTGAEMQYTCTAS